MGQFAPSTWSLTWWRRWPLVGLLLALTFLGHDLLMADAHAVGPASSSAGHHLATASWTAAGTVAAVPDEAPKPIHPAGCEVARPAAPPTRDDGAPAEFEATSSVLSVAVPPLLSPAAGGWAEPTRPPGTRRALLRVFRI